MMVDSLREASKKLILALDVDDAGYALELVEKFRDHVGIFKVGLELYNAAGPDIVRKIHRQNCKVFLDLKFHDIPTTVAKASVVAAREGVFMFNVHASGGFEMMKRCREDVVTACLKENIDRPRIIAVTVLTSMSHETLKSELGVQHSLKTHVRHLAGLALKAGLDGVVSSAEEAEFVRGHCGRGFLIVCPGIRPLWSAKNDQERVMTPARAVSAGADYLVMGRAILSHSDPLRAAEMTLQEIAGGDGA